MADEREARSQSIMRKYGEWWDAAALDPALQNCAFGLVLLLSFVSVFTLLIDARVIH